MWKGTSVIAVAAAWWLTRPVTISADALPEYTADPVAGERLFWAGGCASCHAKPVDGRRAKGADRLALGGGVALESPYGTFHVPNISPHADGIGGWTTLDFVNAMLRGVAPDELAAAGAQILLANTYHLLVRPGVERVEALGGLHRVMGWNGPILTDSGGFQIYSLIRQNPKFGSISERGAQFQTCQTGRKFKLTPEKSVQLQMSYGADVIICLDDCTHVDEDPAAQSAAEALLDRWPDRMRPLIERWLGHREDYGRV